MAETPGQIGYAAYRQTFLAYQHHTSGTAMPEPWERLPLLVQICWETAAQAVLDAWQAQPRLEETPRDREGHATSCSSYTFRPDAGAASDQALQWDADGRPEGHPPADEP